MFLRQYMSGSREVLCVLSGLIILGLGASTSYGESSDPVSTNAVNPGIIICDLDNPGTSVVPNCGARVTYYTPGYFQRNFRTLIQRRKFFPKDILVSGINLNHPVDVYDGQDQIAAALRLGYAPQQLFNQQYVSTQLGMALRPDYAVRSTFSTTLECYGVDFAPVTLNVKMAGQPITLTPQMTSGEFFSACDLVANEVTPSPERDDDMLIVASILSLLNIKSN